MPDQLDWARARHSAGQDVANFQLSSFEKLTRLEMDWWMKSMEYEKLRAEVIAKQIENATSLQQLNDYRTAGSLLKRSQRVFQKKYVRAEKQALLRQRHYAAAELLFNGEFVSSHQAIHRGWNGFLFCCRDLIGKRMIDLGMSSAIASDFYHAKKKITNFPRTTIWGMVLWCKKWTLIPRQGSRAQVELGELFSVVDEIAREKILAAQEKSEELHNALNIERKELFKLTQSKL